MCIKQECINRTPLHSYKLCKYQAIRQRQHLSVTAAGVATFSVNILNRMDSFPLYACLICFSYCSCKFFLVEFSDRRADQSFTPVTLDSIERLMCESRRFCSDSGQGAAKLITSQLTNQMLTFPPRALYLPFSG